MRRGFLLLVLFVAACAPAAAVKPPAPAPAAQPAPQPPVQAPAQPTTQPAPQEEVPKAAPVPAPVQAAPLPPVSAAAVPGAPAIQGALSFDAWRAQFVDKAVARGFDRGFVVQELSDVALNPRVLNHDTGQPEFVKPISDYIRAATAPAREAEGRQLRLQYPWMNAIEPKYGVPPEVVTAIWAEESGFGKIQGDYDVISAFATLAYDGRRRDWAEDQLMDALTIIRDKGIPRARLKGSWAGAMGQTQFIPGAYLAYGQDGDGDGRIDIWNDPADALATAANHLEKQGWRRGESWAVEVIVPAGFDYSISESEKHPPSWWWAKGVRRADGRPWSAPDLASEAMLLVPAGASGPAFLAFPNHFVIRKYNNSIAYALSVGLMADAIAGRPPLHTPWPHEVPLSREQRFAAQLALSKLGYPIGLPDGMIGANTRVQLRAWQKKNGLVADGYLTPELVERLKAAAG
jgi:lytic murein transglycosylase